MTTTKSRRRDSINSKDLDEVNQESPKSKPKKLRKIKRKLPNIKINLANWKFESIRKISVEKEYGFWWTLDWEGPNFSMPGKNHWNN